MDKKETDISIEPTIEYSPDQIQCENCKKILEYSIKIDDDDVYDEGMYMCYHCDKWYNIDEGVWHC